MKTYLLRFTYFAALTLLLAACGGGGSTDQNGTTLTSCEDTNGDKGYAKAAIVTGKTLTNTTATTQLRLWHTADGKRRACIR